MVKFLNTTPLPSRIFWGVIEIFFICPPPYTKKISFLGGIKNEVTEMIHLLNFQSINNVLYFSNLAGIEYFYTP